MKKNITITSLILTCLLLAACSPEIGSEKWCDNLKAKSKADWSANELKDFAKHCILN